MGGYSLFLEKTGALAVTEILNSQGMSFLNALVIKSLPFGKITLAIFTVLSIIFYATTIDSSAYVISSICAKDLKNTQEPRRWNRITWAVLLALITAGLLQADSLQTTLSMTVVSSLPMIPILILLCISIRKWLEEDFAHLNLNKEIIKTK